MPTRIPTHASDPACLPPLRPPGSPCPLLDPPSGQPHQCPSNAPPTSYSTPPGPFPAPPVSTPGSLS
eukprot:1683730-Lingulodinium_polyedra.AAC.1